MFEVRSAPPAGQVNSAKQKINYFYFIHNYNNLLKKIMHIFSKYIRKIIIFFLAIILNAQAKEPLRTEDAIEVEEGKISESEVLSDPDGKIFLEFSEDNLFVYEEDHAFFTGEILPPEIVPLLYKPPRMRMKEIFTFELLSDTADTVNFSDKFDIMDEKSKTREKLLNPDDFKRKAFIKIFCPISEEVNNLSLWKFLEENEDRKKQWKRLGGKLEESDDPEIKIFSVNIKSTGLYTIFEENPSPEFVPAFPLDKIEAVETAPEFENKKNDTNNLNVNNTPVEENFEENEMITDENLFSEDNLLENFDSENLTYDQTNNLDENNLVNDISEIPALEENNNLENINKIENNQIDSKITEEKILSPNTELTTPQSSEEKLNTILQNSELPKSGPEKKESKNSYIWIVIFFSLGLLGTSVFFAIKKTINP